MSQLPEDAGRGDIGLPTLQCTCPCEQLAAVGGWAHPQPCAPAHSPVPRTVLQARPAQRPALEPRSQQLVGAVQLAGPSSLTMCCSRWGPAGLAPPPRCYRLHAPCSPIAPMGPLTGPSFSPASEPLCPSPSLGATRQVRLDMMPLDSCAKFFPGQGNWDWMFCAGAWPNHGKQGQQELLRSCAFGGPRCPHPHLTPPPSPAGYPKERKDTCQGDRWERLGVPVALLARPPR